MIAMMTAMLLGQSALYELDRQTGTLSLAVVEVGDGLNGFGSPSYSPDEQSIAFDVREKTGRRLWRLFIWDRTTGDAVDVGGGNYPVWSPDGDTLLAQTLYDDRELTFFPVAPPHTPVPLGVRRYSPELSPDGRFVLTNSPNNTPKTESVQIDLLTDLAKQPDGSTLNLGVTIGGRPEFAYSPVNTLPDDRPVLATLVVPTSGKAETISAIDLTLRGLRAYVGVPRVLLTAGETHTELRYPTAAATSDEVAFRSTRPDGGYSVGLLRQDVPEAVTELVRVPKGVDLQELRMSPSGRYVCFKSDLFYKGPIDGQLLEPEDLLPGE